MQPPPPSLAPTVIWHDDLEGWTLRQFLLPGGWTPPQNTITFWFHLNGSATASHPGTRQNCALQPSTFLLGSQLTWILDPSPTPSAVALCWHRPAIASLLHDARPALDHHLRAWLDQGSAPLTPRAFPQDEHSRIAQLQNPPLEGHACVFWFRARIREILAYYAFPSGKPESDFFCTRQRKVASERAAKVDAYLRAHLDETLDLATLGGFVGCSPHYLCRTFSDTRGMTIRRRLRQLRIERAAELLRSGRYNVSEAAIEVGYNSLSHFSKAFQAEKGCLPSQFTG